MSELTAFNAYCKSNGINANGQLATEDLAPAFSAGYKARQDTLHQRVAELEGELDDFESDIDTCTQHNVELQLEVTKLIAKRDAALVETKAMSDQHMEISRECITLKSALREALPIVKDWVHENAGAGHGVISTITAALGEMTDRELLELAAKAAKISDHPNYMELCGNNGINRGPTMRLWNPLTDDGDALRLASLLNLELIVKSPVTYAGLGKQLPVIMEKHHLGDHAAATRRAIVRAAAEIGKGMK